MFAVRSYVINNLLHRKTNPLRAVSFIHLLSSRNVLVTQSSNTINCFSLFKYCSVHTLRPSSAADKRQVDKSTQSSSSDESVLMQVFRKKEQPRQLTVGAKGD